MDNNQNQQQQQQGKNKGGNQGGAKEGITIATSLNPSQPSTLGQQVQGALVTGVAGAIAALACAGVQKGFDYVVGKFTGRKVRPVFTDSSTDSSVRTINIMQELHSTAQSNPEEAKRAVLSVAKRLGIGLVTQPVETVAVVPVVETTTSMEPARVLPVVVEENTTVDSTPASQTTKGNNNGGSKKNKQ